MKKTKKISNWAQTKFELLFLSKCLLQKNMRTEFQNTNVTLFPFLSVLICTMGTLAFIAITFLLIFPQNSRFTNKSKQIKFEWLGAPVHVKPIFFRCYKNRIEYYNFFEKSEKTLFLDGLLKQIEGKDPKILKYLFEIVEINKKIKKEFGKKEHYPLLLVYPEGVFSSEVLIALIEKIKGLNFGIEPMLPNMAIPYQGLLPKWLKYKISNIFDISYFSLQF